MGKCGASRYRIGRGRDREIVIPNPPWGGEMEILPLEGDWLPPFIYEDEYARI